VIIQAGQSGRGRRFAARWGELVFVIFPDLAAARRGYREIKDEVASTGRDPARVRITPAVYCVVAETQAMAEDRAAYIDALAHPLDTLVLLAEALNFDFGRKGLDEPITAEEVASMGGLQALRDRVVRAAGTPNPTARDFVRHSARGTIREFPRFVGTPQAVADGLEEWFTTGACDGFVLAATHMPGAYDDFVRLAVPELQRRGLFRRAYPGATLRDTLGLPRAGRHDWKT
jgi:alkanesulfonate monooxygenase SsuD/methylene tetrahydromethanopterin reductase-like flavin-dependent oxidoreductase (luciferase family)